MGYTTGQKITLKSAPYYVSATASKSLGTKTGTFYIWSAATQNGRIRVTSKKSYAGKNPASKYVTCWIKTSGISSSTSSNSKTGTSSSSTASGNKSNTTAAKTQKAIAESAAHAQGTSTSGKQSVQTVVKIAKVNPGTPPKTVPGQIGYLGKVLFVVSASTIRTLTNFVWTTQAKYSEHERHLKRPTLEFTGLNSEKITFDMELSNYLGASVLASYNTLRSYLSSGTAMPLKIGSLSYGSYQWCVEALTFKGGTTDKNGNWVTATVSVSLISVEKKG